MHVRVYVFMVLLETIVKLKVIDFVIFLWFKQFTFRGKYLMILFFLDPCVDVTCNDQGKVDTSTDACACLCFHGFTGDNCETEGN